MIRLGWHHDHEEKLEVQFTGVEEVIDIKGYQQRIQEGEIESGCAEEEESGDPLFTFSQGYKVGKLSIYYL